MVTRLLAGTSEDHRKRKEQISFVVEELRNDPAPFPAIIGGDFNGENTELGSPDGRVRPGIESRVGRAVLCRQDCDTGRARSVPALPIQDIS